MEGVAPSLPKFRPAGCHPQEDGEGPPVVSCRPEGGTMLRVPGRSPRSAGARWKCPVAPAGQ